MNATQLKNSILQYAMQGKLVPQDPNDEPAIELIQHIMEEKERLVSGKLLKKEKTSSLIIEEQIPYDLPANWKWTTLGEISIISGGKRIPAGMKLSEVDTGYKYIRVADMKNGSVDTGSVKFISAQIYEKIKNYTISKNDLYITVAGTIGKVGFIPPELDKANLTENANKIQIFDLNKKFIYFMLQSPVIQSQITEVTTKVGQPKLAIIRIKKLMIPLPPNKEQQRIVEKIEKLFERIDSYYQNKKQLDKLQVDFPTKLENSILHYAMQGKLVEQDPNDKPATELIEHVRREKEILIKEKVLKKEKELAPISDEEVPFDIPENWAWVRIKDITNFGNASTINPEKINAEDWVLDLEEIEKNTGQIINVKLAKEKPVKSNKYKFSENEVLYGKLRPYLNKVAIAPKDGYCTTEIIPLKIYGNINVRYMQLALMSPYFIEYANSCSYGVKMPRLGTQQIANALIPLPPLKEQKRIVNKIEESFHTTEKLK